MSLKGRTSPVFKQICGVALSRPLESPRVLKPSLPHWFLIFPNCLMPGTSKGFWRKKFSPLLFLLWTCHITRFPLMKRPTAWVPLLPTKMETWNCTLWDLCGSLGAPYSWFWRRCVSSTWILSLTQQHIILTPSSPWGTHVGSLRAEICICLVHSCGFRI